MPRAAVLACALCVACSSPSDESNPLPTLTAIDPNPVIPGTADPTVDLTGTGFVPTSHARVDGADRTTTYVSPTSLTLELTAADVSGGQDLEVSVVNGPPGGGVSGILMLSVEYPRPAVTQISPISVEEGSPAFTLTVDGTGFVEGISTVLFNGNVPTTFVSPTRLTAVVPATSIATGGFVSVRVANQGPGGGTSPTGIQFAVNHRAPVITSVSPTTIVVGRATRISVVGQHFKTSTRVVWNGATRTTQVVSGSVLYADLPASAFTAPGAASVVVRTDPPSGGDSNGAAVTLVAPPPRITGFTPASASAGGADFTLTINGADFVAGSTLYWEGVERPSTVVNATTITASISASDIASPGSGMVRVVELGGQESQVVGFPILESSASVTDTLTVELENVDIVTDPAGDVVYAAVPSSAAQYPNEVVALDPQTGAVLWHTFAGSDPSLVRVSTDGAFLYVGLTGASSVSRIDVDAETKDLDIVLPSGSRAEDIVPLLDQPTSIAVSLRNTCCSPRHEGVAIYDGAVQRPLLTQGHTGSNRIEPGPWGERLYGYNNETTEFGFRRILVRSDGLLQDGVYEGLISGFGPDIIYDGGLIFSSEGRVVEPELRVLLGTIAGVGHIRPDVANGRVHFLDDATLTAYHYATFNVLGSITVPTSELTILVRYGPDGMAIGGGSRIVFVRSPLIGS